MLGSYQREERNEASVRSTSQETESLVVSEFDPNNPPPLTPEQIAEIEALAKMPDSEIDFSDIPPLAERERDRKYKITIGNPWTTPPAKAVLDKVVVDSDIIYWVLNQVGGEGYMDKLNAMLRRAMEEERAAAGIRG